MEPKSTGTNSKNQKLNMSFDLRVVSLLLALIIAGMLAVWQPWAGSAKANDQVIEVTGETKLSATPDEYVFYPMYRFSNADKTASLAEMTKKSDEVVAGLKKLGVGDEKIKTNSNGYGYNYPIPTEDGSDKEVNYELQLTATVNDKELAQKVQDYLLTTLPSGTVTPQMNFSETKRKQLETKARDEATKDARSKADQMSKNLGFNVGNVKSVSDSQGFGVLPLMGRDTAVSSNIEEKSQFNLQPGKNDLSYSVTVVYYIR